MAASSVHFPDQQEWTAIFPEVPVAKLAHRRQDRTYRHRAGASATPWSTAAPGSTHLHRSRMVSYGSWQHWSIRHSRRRSRLSRC
jgi:hypothetical protein